VAVKRLAVRLGPVLLDTPLVAAAGTFGSAWEFARTADLSAYGAVVAKSVAPEPWSGRPAPRLAPTGTGMLNAVGIQNPGIDRWRSEVAPRLATLPVPVWGSAVAHGTDGFATVGRGLEAAGVAAIEINLSCPNLEGDGIFALDPDLSARVVAAVREAVAVPVGAKLSPDAGDIVAVAGAVLEAGADWVVLTNTARGAAIDPWRRRSLLTSPVGGYSGPPLKPIALRCVWEVAHAFPGVPIVGCGGVRTGLDVVEFLLAGASAVALGTVHFAEPRAGGRVLREFLHYLDRSGVQDAASLVGACRPW